LQVFFTSGTIGFAKALNLGLSWLKSAPYVGEEAICPTEGDEAAEPEDTKSEKDNSPPFCPLDFDFERDDFFCCCFLDFALPPRLDLPPRLVFELERLDFERLDFERLDFERDDFLELRLFFPPSIFVRGGYAKVLPNPLPVVTPTLYGSIAPYPDWGPSNIGLLLSPKLYPEPPDINPPIAFNPPELQPQLPPSCLFIYIYNSLLFIF
jgi:hypothetical protein